MGIASLEPLIPQRFLGKFEDFYAKHFGSNLGTITLGHLSQKQKHLQWTPRTMDESQVRSSRNFSAITHVSSCFPLPWKSHGWNSWTDFIWFLPMHTIRVSLSLEGPWTNVDFFFNHDAKKVGRIPAKTVCANWHYNHLTKRRHCP